QIEADLEIFVVEEEETIIPFNHDRTEVLDLVISVKYVDELIILPMNVDFVLISTIN
ncbi:hypothetical protein U1Q18_008847, partial [Sarracenia purpurea var. burkii]